MALIKKEYQLPESNSGSLFVKFEPGENRFRMLDAITFGYINWEDGKPTRYETPSDVPTGAEDVKHFWFVPVWMNDQVSFLEIHQKSVQRELKFLNDSEDWGDLENYDVIVRRDGEGLETEYFVQPCPKKAKTKEAKKKWEEMSEHYKPKNLFTEDGVVYAKPTEQDEGLPF